LYEDEDRVEEKEDEDEEKEEEKGGRRRRGGGELDTDTATTPYSSLFPH